MVAIVQVNVVASDLDRSRDFYRRLGFTFRERRRPGVEAVEAWVSTGTDVTLVLHSPEFASWWDSSTPGPVAGGPEIDVELESPDRLDVVVAELSAAGAQVAKSPVDMPWGQRFAIVLDPDGCRIGLKAPLEAAGG